MTTSAMEAPAEPAAKAKAPGSSVGWAFLSLTRIAIGFVFFWAFIDKLFGLGFSTCRQDDGSVEYMCDAAWVNGARMTEGYLASSSGPFAEFFADLGKQAWTDWPYMIGLAGIGLALIFGIGTKIAMITGPLMLAMMYVSHSWPGEGGNANNPFVDDHMIQALAIIGIVLVELTYQSIGLGRWWRRAVGSNTWLV
jgi:thiosulfate dehydrogenase [quinone] large subunit